MKLFAFTLDLEADYGGVVDEYGIFNEPHKIEEVLEAIASTGAKVTVFAVGEILEKYPAIIEVFEKYETEFHPHSYSHDFNHPDSEPEIVKAKNAYTNYFKKVPTGYRAPRGKISDSGIKLLEKHGFQFDSSIFPSYFPDPFRYLLNEKNVHYYGDSRIVEIPFTSVTPLRLTLSISYIKLLGLGFFKRIAMPDVVCFGSHLHDFIINEKSFNALPIFWRLIYGRNKHRGVEYCMKFLEHVKQMGYTFCYMSEIYNTYKKSRCKHGM